MNQELRLIITILTLLTCCISQAQTDSLKVNQKIDSLLLHTNVDSVFSKLTLPDSLTRSFSKIDSTAQLSVSKVNNIGNTVTQPIDKVNQSATKLTSLPSVLNEKSVLLQNNILSHQSKIKGLDSLNTQVDNIKANLDKVQPTLEKINTPQLLTSAEQKANGLESAVNGKISLFKDKGATGLPDGLTLPGATSINQPELPVVDTKELSLPDGGGLDKSGMKLPALKGKEGNIKIPGVEVPKLEGIKGMEKAGSIEKKIGDVTSLTGKADEYQEDLKNLSTGNLEKIEKLPDELESRVGKLDEMQALEGQAGAYKAMIAKWNADPDVQKETALNLAKEQAVNHFAGKEEQLKVAMEQLSKVKSKTKGAEGVVDLFKKHQNTMKQKPFVERLVPGIVFQIQKPNNVWIDFNPYVGYRLFGRLTAGAGWNERWSVNFKKRHSVTSEHIYGPRIYVEFRWKDYLFLKAETEWMNILPVSIYPAYVVDTSGRRWVGSSFAGIKNVFTFSKSVKGQVQVLYNLYNPDKLSPYSNRLNVRFGFEFPLKKKAKQNVTASSDSYRKKQSPYDNCALPN